MVRISPNEPSLVRLLGALAIGRNDQWLEKRYMVFDEQSPAQKKLGHTARAGGWKSKLQKNQHLTDPVHRLIIPIHHP